MIKVLIFDADGVLIHAERFSQKLAREHGISVEQTAAFFTGPFQKCMLGSADLRETIAPHLPEWGWNDSVDAFLTYWFSAEHSIDEELIAYVERLRSEGVRAVVATNQERRRAEYMLHEMGFEKSFDKLYASAHLGHAKPNQEFYAGVLADMPDVKKDEVLFWDDTLANIDGARAFGIHAELYSSFADFLQKMKGYGFGV